jgi:hypothetical protein
MTLLTVVGCRGRPSRRTSRGWLQPTSGHLQRWLPADRHQRVRRWHRSRPWWWGECVVLRAFACSICTGLVAQVRFGPDTSFAVARCLPTAGVSLTSLPGKTCLLPRPVSAAGEGWGEGERERALLGAGEMDGWRARVMRFARERECCLLVLNLVSSTLPCIRRPRPRSLRQCAVVTALARFWQSRHQIRVLAL